MVNEDALRRQGQGRRKLTVGDGWKWGQVAGASAANWKQSVLRGRDSTPDRQ